MRKFKSLKQPLLVLSLATALLGSSACFSKNGMGDEVFVGDGGFQDQALTGAVADVMLRSLPYGFGTDSAMLDLAAADEFVKTLKSTTLELWIESVQLIQEEGGSIQERNLEKVLKIEGGDSEMVGQLLEISADIPYVGVTLRLSRVLLTNAHGRFELEGTEALTLNFAGTAEARPDATFYLDIKGFMEAVAELRDPEMAKSVFEELGVLTSSTPQGSPNAFAAP